MQEEKTLLQLAEEKNEEELKNWKINSLARLLRERDSISDKRDQEVEYIDSLISKVEKSESILPIINDGGIGYVQK